VLGDHLTVRPHEDALGASRPEVDPDQQPLVGHVRPSHRALMLTTNAGPSGPGVRDTVVPAV